MLYTFTGRLKAFTLALDVTFAVHKKFGRKSEPQELQQQCNACGFFIPLGLLRV
jgi:hypothetical protein